jgi:hypothetical protein
MTQPTATLACKQRPRIFRPDASLKAHREAEELCLECPLFVRCLARPALTDGFRAGHLVIDERRVNYEDWHDDVAGRRAWIKAWRSDTTADLPRVGAQTKRCAHPECRKRFTVGASTAKRLYCSTACRHRENRRQKREGFPLKTCQRPECRRKFDAYSERSGSRLAQYCSEICRQIVKDERSYAARLAKVKTCRRPGCGTKFNGRPTAKYCSDDCSRWGMSHNHHSVSLAREYRRAP